MNVLIKIVLFSGLLFGEQPSEPFREESIESTVHEPSSDTYWWSAGQEKIFLIGSLNNKIDVHVHVHACFRGVFGIGLCSQYKILFIS